MSPTSQEPDSGKVAPIIVADTQAGQRLDLFCVSLTPNLSRAVIQRAVKVGDVLLNGKIVKPRQIIKTGDSVSININPPAKHPLSPLPAINPSILFEDSDVVVINKPAGISVHPGAGNEQKSTISSWFAARYPAAASVGDDPARPGIVHRLDKDTSGALIIAKTQKAFLDLKEQFKKRRVKKEYLALVFGVPGGTDGRITRPLIRSKRNPLRRTIDEQGKPAVTEWRLEKKFGKFALLRVYPLTGRTHQIRAHLHFLGFPIVGDALYVFKRQRPPAGVTHQLLHAEKITFALPTGKKKTVAAPLPADFEYILDTLVASST
ncbi:MAG: RluA family pseudouridine synthase [bacterium]|nr:RluA family pseudouridine synthase [bacterium]